MAFRFTGLDDMLSLVEKAKTQSSIYNRPADPANDWLSQAIDQAGTESEARRQARMQDEEDARQEAAAQAAAATRSQPQPDNSYQVDLPEVRRYEQPDATPDNPLFSWARTPSGTSFLAGGDKGDALNWPDFFKDPGKFLAESSGFREWSYGMDPASRQELLNRGVPEEAIQKVRSYLEKNPYAVKPIGSQRTEGPLSSIIEKAIPEGIPQRDLVTGVAKFLPAAIPIVGPAIVGADAGSARTPGDGRQGLTDSVTPALASDALGAVTNAVTGGAGGNLFEASAEKAGERVVGKFGESAAAKLASRMAGRGLAQTIENVPSTAAQVALRGQNPLEGDNLTALGETAAISAASGAAIPALGAGLRGAGRAVTKKTIHGEPALVRPWEAGYNEPLPGWAKNAADEAARQEGQIARQADTIAGHTPVEPLNMEVTGIPRSVSRIEEPGVSPGTVDKPHGLYTTPSDVASPHADLGGETTTHTVNPSAKVLTVDAGDTPPLRRGAINSSAGIAALRQLVGDEEFSRLIGMSKKELVDELGAQYPGVDWARYYDRQEVLEGLAGLQARASGYDAIWGVDKQSPAFSEFVGLTPNAFRDSADIVQASPREYAGPEPGVHNLVREDPQLIARGRDAVNSRIDFEVRKGELDPKVAADAKEFLSLLPDAMVADLGSSFVRNIGDTEAGAVAGRYHPLDALIEISKNAVATTDDPSRVIVHEVAHHLDQFVPDEDYRALISQWQRDMGTRNGIMPGSGEGAQLIVDAQPIIDKLARQRELLDRIKNGSTEFTPEERAILHWDPTDKETAILNDSYRYRGGFREWFAEKMADEFLNGKPPAPTTPLGRAWQVVKDVGLTAYNWLLRRGEKDAAARVYANIVEGRYTGENYRPGGMGDASAANMAYNPPRPSRTTPRTNSNADTFTLGELAHDAATGKNLGKISELKVRSGVAQARIRGRWYNTDDLLTHADHIANVGYNKYLSGIRNVTPGPGLTAQVAKQIDAAQAAGEELTNARRLLPAGPVGAVGRFLDPASGFATAEEQHLHATITGSANLSRAQIPREIQFAQDAFGKDALGMLVNDPSKWRPAARLAANIAATAGPAAAGYAADQALGTDGRLTEAGALVGIGAGMYAARGRGLFKKPMYERVELKIHDPNLPSQLKSGAGKFADIIERPEAYKLPKPLRDAVDRYHQIQTGYLTETNAFRKAAGQDLIPEMDGKHLLHWFTPESLEAAKVTGTESAVSVTTPGFSKPLPIEQMRNLGQTYYEALQARPALEIAGDPRSLIQEQAKQHTRIRSNAALIKGIRALGEDAPSEAAMKASGMSATDIATKLARMKALSAQSWSRLPGVDDHLFPPSVVKSVRDLFTTDAGAENPAFLLLDDINSSIRQSLFTIDGSMWSMQGAMGFVQSPATFIANAFPLTGATAFGKRFFDWWVTQPENRSVYERMSVAGGVAGRMSEGLEMSTGNSKLSRLVGKLQPSKLPGIRGLEERGAEAFVPMMRTLVFRHIEDTEALLRASHLGRVPGSRGLLTAAEYALPTAAAAGANAGLDAAGVDDPRVRGTADALAFLATSVLTAKGESALAARAKGRLTDKAMLQVDARAAKMTNRETGSLNRQMLGISNRQAFVERNMFARSPALARNTLVLAKLAVTPTQEGAMARVYLAKTAALLGLGLVGAKYMETGEMDSMDPRDPGSVFSPDSLGRADFGQSGKLGFSNSSVALLRAIFHSENPAGVTGYHPSVAGTTAGLIDWGEGRLPDLTGPATSSLIDSVMPKKLQVPHETPTIGDNVRAGNWRDVGKQLAAHTVPVGIQSATAAGLLGKAQLGQDAGLTGDPKYNHEGEKNWGIFANLLGLNYTPESVPAEVSRIRDEIVRGMFPDLADRTGDGAVNYADLNDEQSAQVRSRLGENADYRTANSLLKSDPKAEITPIQAYIDRQGAINADFADRIKAADEEYKRTGNKIEFKKAYTALQDERRTTLAEARKSLGDQSVKLRGVNMSVTDWLARNTKPEDQAVSDYYGIFDAPGVKSKDGKINFDELEARQGKFMDSLDATTRGYVERRIASFAKPATTTGLADYNAAKGIATPFFKDQDALFDEFAQQDDWMSQFRSRRELESYVGNVAAQYGLTPSQAVDQIGKSSPAFRRYLTIADRVSKTTRRSDPELDRALMEWYDYSPQSPALKREVAASKRQFGSSFRIGDLPTAP